MKPRSVLPSKHRDASSKLAQMTHNRPFIMGGLVRMARRCGNPGCRCAKKDKARHVSDYLAVRYANKRKMIYVPGEWEGYVRDCIQNYHDIKNLMEVISRFCVDHLLQAKKERSS